MGTARELDIGTARELDIGTARELDIGTARELGIWNFLFSAESAAIYQPSP
jgi:hypothetical protein